MLWKLDSLHIRMYVLVCVYINPMDWLCHPHGGTSDCQTTVVWRTSVWQVASRPTKETVQRFKANLHWYKIRPKELQECAADQSHWRAMVQQPSANFVEARLPKRTTQKEQRI